jgi:Fe-S-cluster-containing hydrogenase component 2
LKRLVVKAEKCSGCRYCEMVCSFQHEKKFSPSMSKITVVKEDKFGMDYPLFCRQCDACPPIDSCPTQALRKNEDGKLALDKLLCIGCGACIASCKFEALKIGEDSTPVICDLCGGDPVCVKRCPTKALGFVEAEAEDRRHEEIFRELRERWGIIG